MASLYGAQYTNAFVTVPKAEISARDYNGKIRSIYATWVPAAELAVNDVVNLAKMPAGAKLIFAHAVIPDTGATGTLEIGWAASANGTSEAAASAGIFASFNAAAAANNIKMELDSAVSGLHKTFAAEVDLQVKCTAVTTAITGVTWKFRFDYVVE